MRLAEVRDHRDLGPATESLLALFRGEDSVESEYGALLIAEFLALIRVTLSAR